MAACNAKSVSKSPYYWKKIPTPIREQIKQMCVRAGITEGYLDGLPVPPSPDMASGQGQVRIDSVPQAKILFDGVDAGTTPVLVKACPASTR